MASLTTVTLHIDTTEADRLLSELRVSLEQAVVATEAAAAVLRTVTDFY
jgi:hypothetical protein